MRTKSRHVEGQELDRPRRLTALDLDPLELAAGIPLGLDGAAPALPPTYGLDPRVALEQEVLSALRRPPCVVSFSGGRDSSALLALATFVARREGLPLPIPLTWRFPAHPATNENEWQELVVEHLALPEWERLTFDDEFEVLGRLATETLRTHGLLWPANIHLNLPALDRARGGSLLITHDLRFLMDGWHFGRVQAVLHGRARPEARDALRVAAALTPLPLRRIVGMNRQLFVFSWLRRGAHRALLARRGGRLAQPRRWDRWLDWYSRGRPERVAAQSLAILGQDKDVRVCHPTLSPHFLAALARAGGAAGLGSRDEVMERLFGGLLPKPVLARRGTHDEFGSALWGSGLRAFAAAWDGTGVDHSLVDAERLRAIWTGKVTYLYAATVAQAAWVSANAAAPAG